MSEIHDTLAAAISEARRLQYAADTRADTFAELLEGRLRNVRVYRLRKLKRELSQFNANTGRWKN